MSAGRITNETLAARIDAIKEYNTKQFSELMGAIKVGNDSMIALNIKVGIQNGCVKQLQADRANHAALIEKIVRIQAACPAKPLADEYHADKKKSLKNPISWLVNNWVQVLIVAAIIATIFMLFPGALLRVWSVVSGTQLEIGL